MESWEVSSSGWADAKTLKAISYLLVSVEEGVGCISWNNTEVTVEWVSLTSQRKKPRSVPTSGC